MTVTHPSPRTTEVDEAQLLFREARQRRRRRRLIGGIASISFLILFGIVIGVVAIQGGGSSPRPVAHPAPSPPAVAANAAGFSIRPLLCYAPPYAVASGLAPSTGPLPACSPSSQLTTSNLQVTPDYNVNGYTVNTNIASDPQFATYPSTASSSARLNQDVLLAGDPAQGSGRYVLGPAGLTRSAIATARATRIDGVWAVDMTLTPQGSARWDALAHQQFHALVGVVIGGRVVSAPITQPTQSSFTSFDGQLQISGSFTEHQARAIASEL
jgi:hypothetical protein